MSACTYASADIIAVLSTRSNAALDDASEQRRNEREKEKRKRKKDERKDGVGDGEENSVNVANE